MFSVYIDGVDFIITYPHYPLVFNTSEEVFAFCKTGLQKLNLNLIELSDLVRKYIIREPLSEPEKQQIFGTRKQ